MTMTADWETETAIKVNGRNVEPGTELTIEREKGRFRFLRLVRNEKGAEWIDVYGGPKGHENLRAFRTSRVKRVHRDRRMRTKRD